MSWDDKTCQQGHRNKELEQKDGNRTQNEWKNKQQKD